MRRFLCLSFGLLLLLSGCSGAPQTEDRGSFTVDKTYSYDEALYAVQDAEERDGTAYAVVSICSAQDDEFLFSFAPARALDFWGVCWESGSYDLWICSGDIGTLCYAYEDGQWDVDPSAVRPEDIVSRYD